MKNITYIFGAGASKKALPIVNEIPERLTHFKELISKVENELPNDIIFNDINCSKSQKIIQLELIEDVNWLIDKSKKHASIDTFAKKLYLTGDNNNLKRLKNTFSAFLTLEQFINDFDNRYDNFFASILNEDIRMFPSNIRILSWNYDFQFELAYDEYNQTGRILQNQGHLNTYTKEDSRQRILKDEFAIVKLNGTARLLGDRGHTSYLYFNETNNNSNIHKAIQQVIRNYGASKYIENIWNGLSFAWEEELSEYSIIDIAKEISENTEILIIIGYSFPFFNRGIDREIIRNMKKLTKVYFQSPDSDILKERFFSIREDINNNMLISRKDVEQFLIPNEL